MNKIGIDLGGTKIEGILTDENYQTITRKRIPTNQGNGYNSILELRANLTSSSVRLMPLLYSHIACGVI